MRSLASCVASRDDPSMHDVAARAPHHRLETVGRIAFALLGIGIALRLSFAGDLARQNVYLKVFAPAASAFASGGDLYTLEGGFRYPPLAAAMLLPFTWCGDRLGSILWRLLNWWVLWCGVRAMFASQWPRPLASRDRGIVWLVVTLAAIGSLNNGQPNIAILGLSLLATTGFLRVRAAGPALAVAANTVFKVYPLAWGLVLAALRPRLLLWLVPAIVAAIALPFALADASYVRSQYSALVDLLAHEDRTTDFANAYRDLRLLTAAVGLPIGDGVFRVMQLLGGALIAATALLLRRRGHSLAFVVEIAFSLTSCWYMLLGPATEKVTYVLLAPTVAWGLASGLARGGAARGFWIAVAVLFVGDNLLGVPRDVQAAMPWTRCGLPLAALLVTIAVVRAATAPPHAAAVEEATAAR